jgi:hypothetical protein
MNSYWFGCEDGLVSREGGLRVKEDGSEGEGKTWMEDT